MRNRAAREESLFEIPSMYDDQWRGMPEYVHDDLLPHSSVTVYFESLADRGAFSELVKQPISDLTKALWYPKAEVAHYDNKRYVNPEKTHRPEYPIFIISKGRWESRHTSKALEKIDVPYRIVIEPQEYDQYAAVINPLKILVLPFSNLGQGSIPARNWVWEYAIGEGHTHHWILDDNLANFFRFNRNLHVPVSDGTIFRVAELFVNRYENIGLSGFNYRMFVLRRRLKPPYYLNTRIYSCILVRNDIPLRWRGKYNEDTDLSIRVLKSGLCTILFNAFLARKETTMTMKGGNTDELYTDDGRLKMAQSLKDQHPELVEITEKWGRYQHHVDYRPFKKNKLVLKPGVEIADGINDYGMELKTISEE